MLALHEASKATVLRAHPREQNAGGHRAPNFGPSAVPMLLLFALNTKLQAPVNRHIFLETPYPKGVATQSLSISGPGCHLWQLRPGKGVVEVVLPEWLIGFKNRDSGGLGTFFQSSVHRRVIW